MCFMWTFTRGEVLILTMLTCSENSQKYSLDWETYLSVLGSTGDSRFSIPFGTGSRKLCTKFRMLNASPNGRNITLNCWCILEGIKMSVFCNSKDVLYSCFPFLWILTKMPKQGKTSIPNPRSGTVSIPMAIVCRKLQRKGLFPWQSMTSILPGVTQQPHRNRRNTA